MYIQVHRYTLHGVHTDTQVHTGVHPDTQVHTAWCTSRYTGRHQIHALLTSVCRLSCGAALSTSPFSGSVDNDNITIQHTGSVILHEFRLQGVVKVVQLLGKKYCCKNIEYSIPEGPGEAS